MIAGHLREKNGKFYMVLNYFDNEGKRKTRWIATGMPVKGNKKRAEALLQETRRNFVPENDGESSAEMQFVNFLDEWLDVVKPTVQLTTYAGYRSMVEGIIEPYFKPKRLTLSGLAPTDLQRFYSERLKTVKARTVIHNHALIHKALKYAVKAGLIDSNPADRVERPKVERFTASFYDSDEMNLLFKAAKDTVLDIPILLGAFYGLRRSEVVGLKWSAIDFNSDTITIRHTVTTCTLEGARVLVALDTTKTKSSMRTLPLVPVFKEKLLEAQARQQENKRLCGKCYDTKHEDYICVNEMGEMVKPDYITGAFPQLLERHGLRKIRFHDLRHSCASLLLANGVPMKKIQDWLGHSDFSTTANVYAHLEYDSKISSANALLSGLKME